MKRLTLLAFIPFVLLSCKKDNNAGNQTSVNGGKIGKPVKITTSLGANTTENWELHIYEYNANTNAVVFEKDTSLAGNITYKFSPHANNPITITSQINEYNPISLGMTIFDGDTQLGSPNLSSTVSQTWTFVAQ